MNSITVEIIRDIRIPFRSHIMIPRQASSDSTRIVEHEPRNAYSVWRRIVAGIVILCVLWALLAATRQLQHRQQQIETEMARLQAEQQAAATPDLAAKLEALGRERIVPANFSWWGMTAAAFVYSLALLVSGVFWWNCLLAFHQPAPLKITLAAHIMGQIGKYIPGKAMVIVMRTATISQHSAVAKLPAVLGVFVETLTMMACGAAIAGAAALAVPAPSWVRWGTFAFGCCAAIPTLPPLFRPILQRIARVRLLRDSALTTHDYGWHLMLQGWLWMILVWLLISLSFWLIVKSTPGVEVRVLGLSGFATTTATISLAMIAGFVSFLPGGAGVRELVIAGILAPVAGPGPALVAAILARLVFLIVEGLAAALAWLYLQRSDLPPVLAVD